MSVNGKFVRFSSWSTGHYRTGDPLGIKGKSLQLLDKVRAIRGQGDKKTGLVTKGVMCHVNTTELNSQVKSIG